MSQLDAEICIVGSGASAIHAAIPLAEAGKKILILEIGESENHYSKLMPEQDWLSLRKKDEEQHRYFLGDDYEGIPLGPVRVGAQLTPARQFMTRNADEVLPLKNNHFAAMQSLASGGLAAGWGASSMAYIDSDLQGWPINREDLQPHYDAISERIGICGPKQDDLSDWVGPLENTLPPANIDSNAQDIESRYESKREKLNQEGLYAGHARLAMATKEHRGRGPVQYRDTEFWADPDRAVYRPQFDLEELKKLSNVTVVSGVIVESFSDNGNEVEIASRRFQSDELITHRANKLVLGAGTINTTRIVLKSLKQYSVSVPLLSNPYTYYPAIMPFRLGEPTRNRRHSLTQLTMIYDEDGTGEHVIQPQIYSYRSLMLYKIIKESPLPTKESLRVMRALSEYLVIVGVFHEDRPADSKRMQLHQAEKPCDDWVSIDYLPVAEEVEQRLQSEKKLTKLLRQLGIYTIKRVDPGKGASIHYAGTFPMMVKGDSELTLTPDGALRGHENVVVVDGCGFPHLPAKGLTMTLMANARRIAQKLV